MTRIVGAVLAAAVGAATAGAQGFVHPVGHHRHGFSLSVWGGFVPVLPPAPVFGFGFAPVVPLWNWGPPVVVVPPPVVVAPPVFGFADPDFSGGIDLAELRETMKPRDDPAVARARVDDAVRRGELLVVDPKGGAKLAGAIRPEPKPAPALVVIAKPNPDPIQRAQAAFEAGELGRADERLRSAILAKPDAPLPHFLLAQVRTARGQYVEAVEAIRDGVKLDPNWPTAKFQLTDLYGAKADRLTTDLAELKAALDAHPDDPTLLFLHAYHLWFGGRRDAAKELFRKAAAKVKDAEMIERFLAP